MPKDITIIGGGPGGYVAAIRAAQLGADVALIEKEELGGTCLNHGCIPTKSLYTDARYVRELKEGRAGITAGEIEVDFSQLVQRKSRVVNRLNSGVEQLLKKNNVELILGEGSLLADRTVLIENSESSIELKTEKVIIATGSKPFLPPIAGIELEGVVTSRELLAMENLPAKLVIIGGGVIGIEFASIMNAFGVEVEVCEMLPRILPQMDEDLSQAAARSLAAQRVNVHNNARVQSIQQDGDGLVVRTDTGEISADKVLVAVGRKPVLPSLDKNLQLETGQDGRIIVDEYLQTSLANVYAIGDVIGGYQLAHVASKEGEQVVENIISSKKKMSYREVPAVVFAYPELASIGLTETEAKKRHKVKIGKFPYAASGKALAMGAEDGFIKVIADKRWDEILGIHIYGEGASVIAGEAVMAIRLEATSEELAQTIHAHPTLPEILMEAAADVNSLAIHK